MKTNTWLIGLFIIGTVLGCKEEEALRKTEQYLETITVDGAKQVKFDKENGLIEIVLPENYTREQVVLDLGLYEGATFESGPQHEVIDKTLAFKFKGSAPHEFKVHRKDISHTRSYTVYVAHEGSLKAELLSPLNYKPTQGSESSAGSVRIKFLGGVGTLPESLADDSKRIIPVMVDPVTNTAVNGVFDLSGFLTFQLTTGVLAQTSIPVALKYGEKEFNFPEKLPLAKVVLAIPNDKLFQPLLKNKDQIIAGGPFETDGKYSLKVENSFEAEPLWIAAKYLSSGELTYKIPSTCKVGNYLVSIYEGTNLLSRYNYNITDQAEIKEVQRIWTGFTVVISDHLYSEPQDVSLMAGHAIYVNPFPILVGAIGKPSDDSQFPELELQGPGGKVRLKAIIKADESYADASLNIYYGAYLTSKDLKPGKYEARLIYPGEVYSQPYYSLINVM